MKRVLAIIGCVLFFAFTAKAADIEFTASASKNTVAVGEQFRVTYTITIKGEGDGYPISFPDFPDFDVLSGPNQSTSSSIQYINGRMSQTVSYSYIFILQSIKEGSFTIEPSSITANGKTYKSNPLTIKVAKGSAANVANTTQQASQQKTQQGGQEQESEVYNGKSIFLKAVANKSNPVQGEQIIVTYKLYTLLNISQIAVNKVSSFSGFWAENLINEREKPKQYNEVINGHRYMVAEIRRVALFPQKTGKLTIDPLEIDVVAQVESRKRSNDPFFDDFFGSSFFGSYQDVQKRIVSNALSINVKSLPSAGQSSSFNGAVGEFTFTSEIDRNQLKANEACNLKFTVSGKGNLKLIDKISLNFPSDFETYDPKITDNISCSLSGVSGKRTFEYLVIPRNPGEYKIPPVEFTYYDLSKKMYVTLTSPEYIIKVDKGDAKSGSMVSAVNQEDIKYIGSDIRFIKDKPHVFHKKGTYFFNSTLHWLLMIIPLLLFIVFMFLWRNYLKSKGDRLLMRNKKATKMARMRLKKAKGFLQQQKAKEFYIEISPALWGYLGDKMGIAMADLSMDAVREQLVRKNISSALIDKYIDLLQRCEFARFAPGDSSMQMKSIYDDALDVITEIEQELK